MVDVDAAPTRRTARAATRQDAREPVRPVVARGVLGTVVTLLLVDAGFGLLPTDPLVGVVTPLRALVITGLLALAVAGVPLRRLRTPLDLPIAVLVAAAALAAWHSGGGWPGVRALVTAVGAYYLMVALRRGSGSAHGLTLVALVVVAAAGSVALAQVAQQVPTGFCRAGWLADAPCRDGALVRATGTFANPNLVAAFLVLLAPLAVLRPSASADAQERLAGGVLVAVAYGGVAVTYSRGGYAAALAGALVLVAALRACAGRRLRSGAAGAVAVVAGVAAVLGVAATVTGALGNRREIWTAAVRTGLEHPLGAGPGRAADVLAASTPSGRPVLHAHNVWLNWFVEAGVLGAAAFLAVTAVALVAGVRAVRAGSRVAAAGLAGLTGLLLMGIADNPLNLGRLSLAFWLVLAVVAAEPARRTPPPPPAGAGRHVAGRPTTTHRATQPAPPPDPQPPLRPHRTRTSAHH